MNRGDLKVLSRSRLREARTLLAAHEWSGAYYLAGYSAECALKACIARGTRAGTFPDKQLAEKSYSHKLSQLVDVAGLTLSLNAEMNHSPAFATYWAVVKDWTETSRYQVIPNTLATDMLRALTARTGVLHWVRKWW